MTAAVSMNHVSKDSILAEVARLVREVIGEEWATDIPILLTSSFADDLELESIEFVALAERLKEKYGKKVDFAGWLAKKELKEIIGLRVGDLVEFIAACLSKSETA
jgi:acyl carrier protein